jgi:hypothetical protein
MFSIDGCGGFTAAIFLLPKIAIRNLLYLQDNHFTPSSPFVFLPSLLILNIRFTFVYRILNTTTTRPAS